MKKTGLLNHRLSDVVARLGHTQRLVISDAGLPIPRHVERIDLAVVAGSPTVIEILTAIAGELQVEAVVFADELTSRDSDLPGAVNGLFPDAAASSVPHVEFKRMMDEAVAVVRTGECTPYYNVMLVSGVTY